jgi:hypothetical protein
VGGSHLINTSLKPIFLKNFYKNHFSEIFETFPEIFYVGSTFDGFDRAQNWKQDSRGAPTLQVIWSFTINSEGQDTMTVLTGGISRGVVSERQGGVMVRIKRGYSTDNKLSGKVFPYFTFI